MNVSYLVLFIAIIMVIQTIGYSIPEFRKRHNKNCDRFSFLDAYIDRYRLENNGAMPTFKMNFSTALILLERYRCYQWPEPDFDKNVAITYHGCFIILDNDLDNFKIILE